MRRYARAIHSTHLEWSSKDLDTLIAAGMTRSRLGLMLLRLRLEWDAVAGEVRRQSATLAAWQREAHSLAADKRLREPTAREVALAPELNSTEALAMRKRLRERQRMLEHHIATEGLTNAALIMAQLRTLEPARVAFQRYARLSMASRGEAPRNIDDLAGLALMLWLDSSCRQCSGRGFHGGYNAPVVLCTACRGTGNRRLNPTGSGADDVMVLRLVMGADAKCGAAERSIALLLRGHRRRAQEEEAAP